MTSPIALEAPVIRLDGVSVRYRVPLEGRRTLKEAIATVRRPRMIEHVALDDLSLQVERGEMLGIIGRNGAGKTTLLNVMARVIHPTSGRLRVSGSVAPMIDLLGGFHPELTGRENVMLRGAFLGIGRAAMQTRLEAIEEFADIGPFFDAPLRTYSAGMIVRLAFAVASTVEADILLIDEALGVGDAEFQNRCAARMREHRERGVTFVVVSHDVMRLQASCDRILWIDGGHIKALGPPLDVVTYYSSSLAT